ncbi:putative prolyl 4-hydroxylase 3 [Canna indica]|uniref:procollagen-proline 4-dioxygenase n=1 Tax=Canna indica TaxID=4628 RepID=A0AAQ3QGA9_9LILI|nr:putative prolyl 4-hydroxylase 3 [Canna indica]
MATMARGTRHPRFLPGRRSSPFTLILAALLTVSVVLLVLLALGIFSLDVDSDGPTKTDHRPRRSVHEARSEMEQRGNQWTEVISWEPRAFLYHNFLSKKECEYLIELAKPHMAKSTVVDSATGQSKDSRVRTSSGMFLRRGQDKIIRTIEKRIADYTFIPVEHGEGFQVLHYEVGQKYEPHYDYFLDEYNTKNGGQRIATLLMYLSDVEEGGETVFPSAKVNSSFLPWYNELSDCGKKGLSVKPKMGDALLFWSMKPDATLDPYSLHGGCPVTEGNKWSATKWMRVHEYKA